MDSRFTYNPNFHVDSLHQQPKSLGIPCRIHEILPAGSLQCFDSVTQKSLQIQSKCIHVTVAVEYTHSHLYQIFSFHGMQKKQFNLKYNASFFVVIALPVKHCNQLAATSITSSTGPGFYIIIIFLVLKRKGKEFLVTYTHHPQRLVLF